MKTCVLECIEKGERGDAAARVPLGGDGTGLEEGVLDTVVEVQMLRPEGRDEFNRMMSDMVGTSPSVLQNEDPLNPSMETAHALAALSGQPQLTFSSSSFGFGLGASSSSSSSHYAGGGDGMSHQTANTPMATAGVGDFLPADGGGAEEVPLNAMLDGMDIDIFLSNTFTADIFL